MSTDYKAMLESTSNHQPTVSGHVEPVVMCLSDDVKRALIDARNLAMTNTVKARIPECGDFGAIAQGLDFICDQLGLNT